MAKYNAIYEGRLPHAMYNKMMADKVVACHSGIGCRLLNIANKAYRKVIDILS